MAFSADTRALKNMGKQLRQMDAKLYRETQKGLRAVGETVAARARANAESFSKTIPGEVKVTAAGVNAVVVKAGRKGGPAQAFEHAGEPGTFRHPVFAPKGSHGDRSVPWVDQAAHPFLHPAALDRLKESAEALRDVLQVQVEKTIHGQDVYV